MTVLVAAILTVPFGLAGAWMTWGPDRAPAHPELPQDRPVRLLVREEAPLCECPAVDGHPRRAGRLVDWEAECLLARHAGADS